MCFPRRCGCQASNQTRKVEYAIGYHEATDGLLAGRANGSSGSGTHRGSRRHTSMPLRKAGHGCGCVARQVHLLCRKFRSRGSPCLEYRVCAGQGRARITTIIPHPQVPRWAGLRPCSRAGVMRGRRIFKRVHLLQIRHDVQSHRHAGKATCAGDCSDGPAGNTTGARRTKNWHVLPETGLSYQQVARGPWPVRPLDVWNRKREAETSLRPAGSAETFAAGGSLIRDVT